MWEGRRRWCGACRSSWVLTKRSCCIAQEEGGRVSDELLVKRKGWTMELAQTARLH